MNGVTVKVDERLIPLSNARPGRKLAGFKGVTIHETGNYRRSAGAHSHALYMAASGKSKTVSAHYYVDDGGAVLCIPEDEVAWHASDGSAQPGGNMSTVCLEVCVNWGYLPAEYAGMMSDVKNVGQASEGEQAQAQARFAAAMDNAAQLAAEVLHRRGVVSAKGWLHQHNHWDKKNRKDCPHNLRKGVPYSWDVFCGRVQQRLDALAGKPPPLNGQDAQQNKEGAGVLYRVQVGAFGKRANALALLEKLKADGYEGFVRT